MSTLLFAGDLWYNVCATQVVGWCAEVRYPVRTETRFTAKADPNPLDDLWLRGNHPVAQAGITVLKVTGSSGKAGRMAWSCAVTTPSHNHARLACEAPAIPPTTSMVGKQRARWCHNPRSVCSAAGLVLQLNKTPLLRACNTRQRLTVQSERVTMKAKPHCIYPHTLAQPNSVTPDKSAGLS